MTDEERRFLWHFQTDRFDYRAHGRVATVPTSHFRGWKDGTAQSVASRWGYVYRGKGDSGNNHTWSFEREDAPERDVVGGPSRRAVARLPAACAEAERVKEESGFDVLDGEACLAVERVAGTVAARSQRPLIGTALSWIVAALALVGVIMVGPGHPAGSEDGIAFAALALTVALFILIGFLFLSRSRRHVREYRELHVPRLALIRRVLRVAEAELLEEHVDQR